MANIHLMFTIMVNEKLSQNYLKLCFNPSSSEIIEVDLKSKIHDIPYYKKTEHRIFATELNSEAALPSNLAPG